MRQMLEEQSHLKTVEAPSDKADIGPQRDVDFIDYFGFKKGSPFYLPSKGGKVEEHELPSSVVATLRNRGRLRWSGSIRTSSGHQVRNDQR